jgi:alpha-beta hydrolase superfamily lysophospholipase
MIDAGTHCTVMEQVATDGYAWRYRRYVPDSTPRAHVVCIHGIQSHGGWYTHSCEQLRQAGFVVSFLDRRGSGMNEQARGDAPGFRRLLDDLAEFLATEKTLRRLLVAISWGGKLAAALQKRHPGLVDGIAFLCPGFFPKVKPPKLQRLGIALSRLFRPTKRYPIPLNEPDLFTASPRWQQFILDDKLGLREATARLLVESVRLDAYCRLTPPHIRVPVLLMLAGRDRIINNDRTRAFFDSFASTDRKVIEYPEAHHTLEFEAEPEKFIGDLREWLEKTSEPRP